MKTFKLLLAALTCLVGSLAQSNAAVFNWSSGATSDMSLGSNWGGSAPVSGGTWNFAATTGATSLNDTLATSTSFNVGAITFASGASTYNIGGSGAGTYTLTGAITNSSTSLQTISDNITLSSGAHVVSATSGAITLAGNIAGAGGVTVGGVNTVTLSGNNTYSGNTTFNVSNSSLAIGSSTALGSGTLTAANAVSVSAVNGDQVLTNNFSTTATGAMTFAGSYSLTLGGFTGNSNTAHTITNNIVAGKSLTLASLALATDTTTTRVMTIGGSGYTIITGAISNGNATMAQSLTFAGTGTTELRSAGTYTGATAFNTAGTVILAADDPFGGANAGALTFSASETLQTAGAARTISNSITDAGGTVTVGGAYGLTLSGAFTQSGGSRNLVNSLTSGTLTLSGPIYLSEVSGTGRILTISGAGSTLVSGAIADFNGAGTAGALTITNTGTTTLKGSSTYSGTTTISAGAAVNIQNATALGSTAIGTKVAAGAELQIQNNITVGAEALSLSGTGLGSGGGAALRNISGNNTYGGLVTLTGSARINSDAGALTLSHAGTITGATFGLTVGGAGTTEIDSIIGTTSGVFTKDGTGTAILGGVNTYTGVTTVSSGTLTIGSTGSINTTSGVSIGAGEFKYNSSTALTKTVTFTSTGGALSGTGAINTAVNILAGNTLAPGNSIGTMTFGNGLTIAGTYTAQLGTPGTTPTSGTSDLAAVTGALTLSGTLSLADDANASGKGSAAAGAYQLITYTAGRTGTFAGIINSMSGTLHEKVVYGATSGAAAVELNLYNQATVNMLSTPISLGNVHVSGTFATSALTIQNTGTNVNFTEGLNATKGATTGDASVSGSNITNLAVGATSTDITVSLGSTSTAGAKTGTVTVGFASNGSTTSGYGNTTIGNQTVTVSGGVYNYAAANSISTPVSLGITHVSGTFANSAVTIINAGPAGSYTEGLNATKGTPTGDASVSGSNITNLAVGATSTDITVSLGNTGTVGAKNGTVKVGFASNGAGTSGLGITTLTGQDQTIAVSGTVNQWAQPALGKASGLGTLTALSGTHYTLDLGTFDIKTGTKTAVLALSNTELDATYQDLLSGAFDVSGMGDFSLSGFDAVSNLAIGGTQGGLSISFNTAGATIGTTYNGQIIFNAMSVNASGATAMSPVIVDVSLQTLAVPEPATWAMFVGGIGMLGFVQRLRRRAKA